MYICLCHALNETAVREACEEGAKNAGRVYSHYGLRPKCGKCVNAMRCAIRDHHLESGCGREQDLLPEETP
ncbi:MAG: (2Fe-2S)-binding protein [Magnetospiraceae bacterium]